ncbi:CopG family antitoxin [Candidatus Gracilibacteria bacterium]|nr:CopG family antitoxin [Candidatus Gracilibacteria bacterium]
MAKRKVGQDPFKINYIDDEEKALIEDIESNIENFINIDSPERREELSRIARNTIMLRNRKSVTLRIPELVIGGLKEKASKKGLPYQTYMNQLLFEDVMK